VPATVLALPDPLQAPQARLRQCLTLALLAHLLLVLVLGAAPPGSARRGEGAWGRLVVRLEGPARAGADSDRPLPDNGPQGRAETARYGGSVRADASRADTPPGAAKLGSWRAREDSAATPATTPVTATAPEPAAPTTATLAPPVPAVATPAPTALPQAAAIAAPPLAPVAVPTATLAAPPAPAKLDRADALAPLTTPAINALPSVARPTATLSQPTATPPDNATPTALPRLNAPALPDAPLGGVAVPTGRLAAPPAPNAVRPARPAPPLQALDAARSLDVLAPIERPTATLPSTNPASPPRSALPAPAPLERSATTAAEAAAPLPESAELHAQAPQPSDAFAQPLQPVTLPAGLANAPNAAAGSGGPDRGDRLGHDVATAPSAKTPTAPLNLNLPMQGPRISSAGASSGLLPAVPRPPDHPDKLEKDVERAKRADCRSAYQGGGLLAVIPLAIDTVRDKGCKW